MVLGQRLRGSGYRTLSFAYNSRKNTIDQISDSLLDVLGYLDEIPMCVAYEIDGGRTDEFPVSAQLDGAKPVLERMPGWKSDISDIREFDKLPDAAKAYVNRAEKLVGVPFKWISNGPRREAVIRR